ncbi:Mucin-associated surface protein (MASP), putative, partial [Trypanosoma cruzi]
MAMMMTGRVLLVCALCVLCCGTGGGDADGSAVEYSLLRWRAQLRKECAEEVGRRTGCFRRGGMRASGDGRCACRCGWASSLEAS